MRDAGTGQPLELASNEGGMPSGIAVDSTHVYWASHDNEQIRRTLIGVSAPETFVAAQPGAFGVALDQDYVYWTTDSGVFRAPKSTGEAEELAKSLPRPYGIALDDANVYVTTLYGNGDIYRISKAGGGAVAIALDVDTAEAITVDEQYVYFGTNHTGDATSNNGSIGRIPKDTQTVDDVEIIRTYAGHPRTLVLADGRLYWTSFLEFGSIQSTSLDGRDTKTVENGISWPSALAVDKYGVYAGGWDGIMTRVPSSDYSPKGTGLAGFTFLALDAKNIYWTERIEGRVWQARR